MNSYIEIAGEKIGVGEEKQINVRISKLPTRTSIDLPIIVTRSKKVGPTLLIMGGLHGDEINGVETVRRIINKGYNRPLIGSTICIPIVNIYGFILFSRQVPDGKDINRSFPGSKYGSLASQMAFLIRKVILPQVEYVIDFHTGGARINNFPQVRTNISKPDNLQLASSFSTRFTINSRLIDRSLRKEADRNDIPMIVFEGGESSRLRKNAVDEGVDGVLRVMKTLAMRNKAPKPKYSSLVINRSSWIRANAAGLQHSFFRAGEYVKKGTVVGLITGPYGDFELPIKSRFTGYVIGVNNNPVINKGDALLHIGITE